MDPQESTGNDAMSQQKNTNRGGHESLRTLTNKPDDKTRLDGHHEGTSPGSTPRTAASAPKPRSKLNPNDAADMEVIKAFLNVVNDLGPDRLTFDIYVGLVVIIFVSIIGFFFLSWSWITAIVAVFITFVFWRHFSLKHDHPRLQTGRRWITRRDPSTPNTAGLPAVYFLYILGSGGHTAEMLETIRRKFAPQTNLHRRYLVTNGDTDSINRVFQLERDIEDAAPDGRGGTIDTFRVPRARRVHQPFYTAPLSCLNTAIHAVNVLTREPDVRPTTRHGNQFKYPHVVITNGPATGFIVCLVAHLLKIFYVVPQNRLKMVYVESWARSRTLSLTGKLFLWTGIADLFGVQHEELARRIGPRVVYVGEIAARLSPPG